MQLPQLLFIGIHAPGNFHEQFPAQQHVVIGLPQFFHRMLLFPQLGKRPDFPAGKHAVLNEGIDIVFRVKGNHLRDFFPISVYIHSQTQGIQNLGHALITRHQIAHPFPAALGAEHAYRGHQQFLSFNPAEVHITQPGIPAYKPAAFRMRVIR